MKLAILGASGACGTQLVQQSVTRGHEVVAIVRSADWAAPAGVTVKRGDLTDVAFLTDALSGCDVVLSALGLRMKGIAPWHRPAAPEFLVKSTKAIVEAAKKNDIKRGLAISAGGVGDSYDSMPGAFKMFIKFSALKHVYPELAKMEAAWLNSGLDVCICRPPGLTDGPLTGRAKVVTGFKGRATISRADVAGWMLDQLTAQYTVRTPLITETGA